MSQIEVRIDGVLIPASDWNISPVTGGISFINPPKSGVLTTVFRDDDEWHYGDMGRCGHGRKFMYIGENNDPTSLAPPYHMALMEQEGGDWEMKPISTKDMVERLTEPLP